MHIYFLDLFLFSSLSPSFILNYSNEMGSRYLDWSLPSINNLLAILQTALRNDLPLFAMCHYTEVA